MMLGPSLSSTLVMPPSVSVLILWGDPVGGSGGGGRARHNGVEVILESERAEEGAKKMSTCRPDLDDCSTVIPRPRDAEGMPWNRPIG
jgi:hypothetical protein